jgi:hypothetical protein
MLWSVDATALSATLPDTLPPRTLGLGRSLCWHGEFASSGHVDQLVDDAGPTAPPPRGDIAETVSSFRFAV